MDGVPAIYASPTDFNEKGPYDFTCPKCKVHFKGERHPDMMCAVLHPKGACCHYGYEVAKDGDKRE